MDLFVGTALSRGCPPWPAPGARDPGGSSVLLSPVPAPAGLWEFGRRDGFPFPSWMLRSWEGTGRATLVPPSRDAAGLQITQAPKIELRSTRSA